MAGSKSVFKLRSLVAGCYSAHRRGIRLASRLIREAFRVRNLAECEDRCSLMRPFTCRSFHFRIADRNGAFHLNPYNCELSDVSVENSIRFDVDTVADVDYDLYTRSRFSASCDRQDFGI